MPRAAIVTGASSGIGLAVTRMLAEEGYAITMAARRPEKLKRASDELRGEGFAVQPVAANLMNEDEITGVVAAHEEAFGRLDVLMNNAGVGIGSGIGDLVTKRMDLMLGTNLRAAALFYREALPMLTAAGAEHHNALVVNTASIAGKRGAPWLSVYSATKFALVGLTQAMNRELNDLGIKSTALCPAFVDTAMADFVKDALAPDKMIQTADIAAAVRMLLQLSPGCVIPEIMFELPGGEQLEAMI